jgi:hypothetical protein
MAKGLGPLAMLINFPLSVIERLTNIFQKQKPDSPICEM